MLSCENLYTFCTTSQWVCEGLKPTRICLYIRHNYFCWLSLCLSCSSLHRELCWMLVSQVVGRVEGAFFLPTTQNPIWQTVHVAVALSQHTTLKYFQSANIWFDQSCRLSTMLSQPISASYSGLGMMTWLPLSFIFLLTHCLLSLLCSVYNIEVFWYVSDPDFFHPILILYNLRDHFLAIIYQQLCIKTHVRIW